MTTPLSDYPDYQRPLSIPTQLVDSGDFTLNAASTFGTSAFDMRSYESFHMHAEMTTTGVPTAYNPVLLRMDWWNDAFFTNHLYTQAWEVFAFRSVAPFACPNGMLHIRDLCKGPYVTISGGNNGVDQTRLIYNLYGGAHRITTPYVQEIPMSPAASALEDDLMVFYSNPAGIGAGVVTQCLVPMAPGNVYVRMATGATQFTYDVTYGSRGGIDQFIVPAGAVTRVNIALGQRSTRWAVTNNGGAGGAFFLGVYRTATPHMGG